MCFGATGRREAKRLKKYPRDFHESKTLDMQFAMKKAYDLAETKMEIPLSDAMAGTKKRRSPYRHITRPPP
jgi:hypothetical protein